MNLDSSLIFNPSTSRLNPNPNPNLIPPSLHLLAPKHPTETTSISQFHLQFTKSTSISIYRHKRKAIFLTSFNSTITFPILKLSLFACSLLLIIQPDQPSSSKVQNSSHIPYLNQYTLAVQTCN